VVDRAVRAQRDDWWAWYRDYLETPKWKRKRIAVIKRDQVCKACETRPAVQAHHLSYARVGDEPLFDLVGVCLECHKKLHARRRSIRPIVSVSRDASRET
jgi:hypothetical protein